MNGFVTEIAQEPIQRPIESRTGPCLAKRGQRAVSVTWKIDDDDAIVANKRGDYVPEGESTIKESMQKHKRRPVINAIC